MNTSSRLDLVIKPLKSKVHSQNSPCFKDDLCSERENVKGSAFVEVQEPCGGN